MISVFAGLLLSAAGITTLDISDLSRAERAAVSATPTVVSNMVEIKDDPFQPNIVISTMPFVHPSRNDTDRFIRAFVDRKTGKTVFQLYFYQVERGDAQHYKRLAYIGVDGPHSIDGRNLGVDVGNCDRWGCTISEDIVVDVPEQLLREVSKDAVGGSAEVWQLRLYGDFDTGFDAPILTTEIAGLLIAVDRQKAALSTHTTP